MKQLDQDRITAELGVAPIFINSSDFSAQSRKRLYWTNIPVAPYEPSMEIVFDILDHNCADDLEVKYKEQYKPLAPDRKRVDICRQPNKIGYIRRNDQGYGVYSTIGKSVSLTTGSGLGGCTGLYMIGNTIRKLNALEGERLQKMPDGYTAVGKLKNTARLRLLGNGWTASVISHILQGIPS
jgi:DNA (cytosine-5)-methyltransferase 3A